MAATQIVDVVDLFAGCGGLSYGFHSLENAPVRFRTCFGVELDPNACASFEAMIGAKAYQTDVRELENEAFRNSLLEKHRGPNPLIVIGGPPCQGFSSHRKKDSRTDARNSFLALFGKLATSMHPEFIVMENVPEIFGAKHWPYFAELRKLLEAEGYHVRAQIYDLAAFGVPQSRYRALMVARKDGKQFSMPVMPENINIRTVRNAISKLPKLRAGETCSLDEMHVVPNHTRRILDLIASVPKDGGSRRDANLDLLPKCHDSVDGFRDVYGRLSWDKPAISITAKSSTPSCGRFLHPDQNRNISVREAALLQGFPPDYKFLGPLVQKYRQVGNAVSPIFSAVVAECLATQFVEPGANEHTDKDIVGPKDKSFSSSIASIKRKATAARDLAQQISGEGGAPPVLTSIDCFAGAGGLSLGLKNAGFKTIFAFDADSYAVETYKMNLGSVISLSKAEDIDPVKLMKSLKISKEECVLMAGGPPCQGFSQQRQGPDDDPRNSLVIWYAKFIAKVRPIFFLLENVPYLAAVRGKDVFAEFCSILSSAGYNIQTLELDASKYGVAQRRHRMISVGHLIRPGLEFAFPEPSKERVCTVRDAIGMLPSPPKSCNEEHPLYANHISAKITPINIERISHVPQGGGWKDIPEHLQLECHKRHRGQGHLDVYGRLSWMEPARTLTAGFDSFSRGQYAHPEENRPITGREAAAIQSFPHWYRFVGPKKVVARQIGNAVPPALAEALGRAILESLEKYYQTLSPRK